ncbi:hypothetical protein [Calothrix sp. NIES-2098]|uniref:hypothetical protein n=1 Tax=Calothrix sp. NIES-2098 TaxID=1954171 RepID=UPI000B6100CE|nr:hypothetical protein NIES2098_15490 [Calothrix sp. NIES-2098]
MSVNSDSQVNIMEQRHQEERETAAQEFQAALDELEDMLLQEQYIEDEAAQKLHNGSVSDARLASEEEDLAAIDIEAFEDAVADIEQYLAERQL